MHRHGKGTVPLLTGGLCWSVSSPLISVFFFFTLVPFTLCKFLLTSLSSPALPAPSPSLPPVLVGAAPLGGNVVVVAGISLCLAVILATVVVTVWRKLCQTPQCSSVRRGSMHSPGGRKLSDEASICGHSLQRPSLSDGHGPQGGMGIGAAQKDTPVLASQPLSQTLVMPVSQDPERLSPGQKMLPTIFGYVWNIIYFCHT